MLKLSFSYAVDQIIHSINLDLATGELVGVLGPSGIGKSRLLGCIAGLHKELEGTLSYNGQLWNSKPPWHRKAVYVAGPGDLIPDWTVQQTCENWLSEAGLKKQLTAFQLELTMNNVISELSLGQRQRVNLLRALASHPNALLLDEVFTHLDQKLAHQIESQLWQQFYPLQIPGLIVDHDPARLAKLCNRVLLFEPDTPPSIFHWSHGNRCNNKPLSLCYNIVPITRTQDNKHKTPIGKLTTTQTNLSHVSQRAIIHAGDCYLTQEPQPLSNSFPAQIVQIHQQRHQTILIELEINNFTMWVLQASALSTTLKNRDKIYVSLPPHKISLSPVPFVLNDFSYLQGCQQPEENKKG